MEDKDFVVLSQTTIQEIGEAIQPLLTDGNRLMCSKPVHIQDGFAEVHISDAGTDRRLLFPVQTLVMVSRGSPRGR